MSLRIALLKSSFHQRGGLEKYCLRIAESLRNRGHTVSILTSSPSSERDNIIKICSRVKPSALQLIWFDWCCRRYLRRCPYDIVFGFDRHFLPLTHYRAGNGCHASYLSIRKQTASFLKKLSFYCNPLHILTKFSERLTFECHPPRAIICNSHLVKGEILKEYPAVPKDRLHVIHNGVEWHEYEKAFVERKESNIPRILFIGHEWKRKGLELALQALSFIRNVPFHMVAVGKERDPSFFMELVRRMGLAGKVELYPTSKPSLPFFQASDIALLPSLYDPFANATVEALAMGLYVVTTHTNGGSEIIREGKNGSIVDFDPKKCSERLLYAFKRIRQPECQNQIRESVRHLDFPHQLQEIALLVESGCGM